MLLVPKNRSIFRVLPASLPPQTLMQLHTRLTYRLTSSIFHKHQQEGPICNSCSTCSLVESHNCRQLTVTVWLSLQRTPNVYLERERAIVSTQKHLKEERQTEGKGMKEKMMMSNRTKFLPLGKVEAELL